MVLAQPQEKSVIQEKLEKAIVEAYQRGDKVHYIHLNLKVSKTKINRVLSKHNIPLRRPQNRRKNDAPAAAVPPLAELSRAVQGKKMLRPPVDFSLTITSNDLAGLDDTVFIDCWNALGTIISALGKKPLTVEAR